MIFNDRRCGCEDARIIQEQTVPDTQGETAGHLFVYGSLASRCRHPMGAVLRRHARLIGAGEIAGWLFDLGAYPGAVANEEHAQGPGLRRTAGPRAVVHGEIYRICAAPPLLLRLLDRYEGCAPNTPEPPEFVRRIIMARLAGGRAMPAWAYLYNRGTAHLRPVASGRFKPCATMPIYA